LLIRSSFSEQADDKHEVSGQVGHWVYNEWSLLCAFIAMSVWLYTRMTSVASFHRPKLGFTLNIHDNPVPDYGEIRMGSPPRGRLMQVRWVKIGHFRRKTRYNSKMVQDRRIFSIKVE